MADVKYFADLTPIGVIDGSKIIAVQSDPAGSFGWKSTLDELGDFYISIKTYSSLTTTAKEVDAAINELRDSISGGRSEPFIATAGQTSFTITVGTPFTPTTSQLAVQGQLREYGASKDYTISGNTITWYNNDYTMQNNDLVQIWFDTLTGGGAPVDSVFGRIGIVTAQSGDYTVGQVTGAAASGANSDITSLSGLTTPLSIAQGGTNSGTALTNDKVMISSAGAIIESTTITTAELGLLNGMVSVSTGAADNDKLVTEGFVNDAIAVEDLWDKSGTNLSPKTAGDDILLNAGESLTITDLTLGSVLFVGTAGLVNQDNTNLFWDNTNKSLGIGTATPNASALLELSSTTKGFLPSQMTTVQRDAIGSPQAGLMIYNTATNQWDGYNGSAWVILG